MIKSNIYRYNDCNFCGFTEKIALKSKKAVRNEYCIISFKECTNCQSILGKYPELKPFIELIITNFELKICDLESEIRQLKNKND